MVRKPETGVPAQPSLPELYERALELSGDERDRFLDTACAGAPRLRRELEELLAADGREGGFLDNPHPEAWVGIARDTIDPLSKDR